MLDAIHDTLTDIASLVESPSFRDEQEHFYRRFAHEFDAGDNSTENKLAYTQIHNDYVHMVEESIKAAVGPDRLSEVEAGLERYIESQAYPKSEAIAQTLEILTSMADYEHFKQTMLMKKSEVEYGGGAADFGKASVVDLEGSLDLCQELMGAASLAEGWKLIVDEAELTCWTKPGSGKDTFMRMRIVMDIDAPGAVEMVTNFTSDSIAWRSNISWIEAVKDYGPDDLIVRMGLKMPWVLKYMMSLPDEMCMRIVLRRDFPNVGDVSYCVVPFDLEQNVALSEWGPMKIKTGVISADPENPNRAVVYTLDAANLSMMPSWGMAWMLKAVIKKQFGAMLTEFKKFTGR